MSSALPANSIVVTASAIMSEARGPRMWTPRTRSVLASAMTNKPAEVYPWSRPEAAAANWLGAHSTASDVVLASTELSNPLVGVIDGRVVHGHIVATFNSDAKQAMVGRFFAADATVAERSAVLLESHATLVAFGPRERALGATSLHGMDGLRLIYDADGVQIYRL